LKTAPRVKSVVVVAGKTIVKEAKKVNLKKRRKNEQSKVIIIGGPIRFNARPPIKTKRNSIPVLSK
jgi:hypothetical protein